VFLTFAAALAYRRGITDIIGGMCETDYSGYPDCRDETIRALTPRSTSAWPGVSNCTRR
jgi:7-cyano-7-deazaguanine synthase